MKKNHLIIALKPKCTLNLKLPLVMKISLVLLFFVALQLNATTGFAQRTRGPISKSNSSIEQVLNLIEQTSDYVFLYNDKTINTNKVVSVNSKSGKIPEILDEIFRGTNITYTIVDKQIILSTNNVNGIAQQSDITVKGIVKDTKGEALIGVNIKVKGSSTGTITDLDGNFSIQVKKGAVIIVSYTGYTSKNITVSDARLLNIVLEEDRIQLDEVVVTALGIKKEAKSLSYNVQQVNSDEITRIADANFVNNLNGKVAGVTINASSSGVGGSSRVVMRGTKSINGNNNALYVVDGIPMIDMNRASTQPTDSYEGAGQSGDPISGLNPDDIENVSVLSGPSAAALYGSAAANGVVMITTKKGKEGRTSVTITNNTTFSAPLVLPKFQNTYGATEVGSYYSWGTKLNTPSNYDPKDFFQTGLNVTNTASLSTGTDKNQTYVSLGTTNANGVIHNNNYERYNATIRNVSKMLKDKLTLDLSFMLSSVKEQNMTSQGLYFNPLVSLYLFPAGDDFSKVQAYQRYDAERNLMTQYWPYSTSLALQNPYWITEHINMPNHKNRYMATASVKYDFAKWINLSGRVKMDRNNERRERMYDAGTNTLFASKYGYYSKSNIENQQVYGELLLNINKYFVDNTINVTANVGANFENNDYQSDYFGGKLKSVANLFTFGNVDPSEKNLANQYAYHLKKRAVFASAQVGYKSRIYLDVTARNDWSSTFKGTNTNSFFYPSIGLSGILTDLFHCSTDIMPYMKVRVSYSEVGNSPEMFLAIPTYALVDGVPVTQSRRPNPNLRPERTKSWEVGANVVFFKNRLKLDASLYSSRTYNQFFERTLSSTTGYKSEVVNGGRVDNKGLELSLRYEDHWGSFGWNSYLTYSLNRNKVVELLRNYEDPYTHELTTLDKIDMGGTSMYKMMLFEGGSIGDIYVNTLRTDEHGAIYVHPSDQQVVTQPDVFVKAGNSAPKYNLGWGNTLTYKNISLGCLFTARVGGIVVSQTQAVMDAFGASKATADARDNGGALVNGRPIGAEDYYHNKIGSAGGQGGIGSMYTYSATNVRLAELSLGYEIPITQYVTWIKGLNVSFIGKNLFFLYRKAPFDPELTASTGTYFQGIDMFMSPSLRNLGFSVKVKF